MNKNPIETPNAPVAIGTYSQAIDANGAVYLSGQIPLVPETMELGTGGSLGNFVFDSCLFFFFFLFLFTFYFN